MYVCAYLCFFCLSLKGGKKDNNSNSNNRRTVALPTFESRNLFKDNGQINMYICMRLGEQTDSSGSIGTCLHTRS